MELLSSSCAPTESPMKELNIGFAARSGRSITVHSANDALRQKRTLKSAGWCRRPSGLEVSICERAADLPFPLNLGKHNWIKTDTYEAGMGGMNGNVPAQNGNSDWPYDRTQTVDHTGQSKAAGATCRKQRNVDEQCVNSKIRPGQPTGAWTPFNQCQSFVHSVVGACRYGPQLGPTVPNTLQSKGPVGGNFSPVPRL